MPKTDESGRPRRGELPDTIRRSSHKAQRTFAKAHDSALDDYGSEERAHRVAYSALKHSYEKVGDHWEAKADRGPSDSRDESGGPHPSGESQEGVDANATKKHLLEIARRLQISGRSTMRKNELIEAIKAENRHVSSEARSATDSHAH